MSLLRNIAKPSRRDLALAGAVAMMVAIVSVAWGLAQDLLGGPEAPDVAGTPGIAADDQATAQVEDHTDASGHGESPQNHGGDTRDQEAAPEISFELPHSATSPLVAKLRLLQGIQERLAHGDEAAVPEQREVLISIGDELQKLRADHVSLAEIYAATTYLLSGGRPGSVSGLVEKSGLPLSARKLIEGAILYSNGDPLGASDKIKNLVPAQFPAVLGGHLALVQARVSEGLSDDQRIELLKVTAYSLPGTLLEEAALRRIMEIGANALREDAFVKAAIRYQRRFANSLYNSEYRAALVDGVAQFEAGKRPISEAALDQITFGHTAARRDDILQRLAEIGLRKGYRQLCQYAASRQRRLSVENSANWVRATSYIAACGVVEHSAEAVTRIRSLDVSTLTARDKALHHAALKLAEKSELKGLFDSEGTAPRSTTVDLPEDVKSLLSSAGQDLEDTKAMIESSR